MMPPCAYRRCLKVADTKLGTIISADGQTDGFGKPWEQVEYVCKKHQAKILKLLGKS